MWQISHFCEIHSLSYEASKFFAMLSLCVFFGRYFAPGANIVPPIAYKSHSTPFPIRPHVLTPHSWLCDKNCGRSSAPKKSGIWKWRITLMLPCHIWQAPLIIFVHNVLRLQCMLLNSHFSVISILLQHLLIFWQAFILVYSVINGACHIWQGNISVIRHFQIPLFFRRATPPAVFVTEPWMRCQNVRPNREWCAMTFISDRGYDVRPRGEIAAKKNA